MRKKGDGREKGTGVNNAKHPKGRFAVIDPRPLFTAVLGFPASWFRFGERFLRNVPIGSRLTIKLDDKDDVTNRLGKPVHREIARQLDDRYLAT